MYSSPMGRLRWGRWGRLERKRGKREGLARKLIVKVVLSKEQKEILTVLSTRLGTSESETMQMTLMDYVKELSLMSEALHKGSGNKSEK